MKITINITKKDLANSNEAMDRISDYPLYASTCNVSRCEAIVISKIIELGLQNDSELEMIINIKSKTEIFNKYPELKRVIK